MARTLLLRMPSGIASPAAELINRTTRAVIETIALVESATKRDYTGTITAAAATYDINLKSGAAYIGGDEVIIAATDGITYRAQSAVDTTILDAVDNLPPDPADASDIATEFAEVDVTLATILAAITAKNAVDSTDIGQLTALMNSPRKIVTDEGSVEERSASELIAADQHINAQAVGDLPLHGLRISQFKPAGAV